MAHKDDRGRYHEYYSDCSAANRRYREEKEQLDAIESAAKRSAEAAEEQNRLLILTEQERVKYRVRREQELKLENERKIRHASEAPLRHRQRECERQLKIESNSRNELVELEAIREKICAQITELRKVDQQQPSTFWSRLFTFNNNGSGYPDIIKLQKLNEELSSTDKKIANAQSILTGIRELRDYMNTLPAER
jgi:hypothetical protein